MTQTWAVGRRKTSVARVKLVPGKGAISINKTKGEDYFGGVTRLFQDLKSPLEITKTLGKYDISVNVKGGGVTGQAGAIRLGIARALAELEEANQKILRKEGLLTRDSRMVERKKPGQPKARKSFQFSKR